MRRRLASIGALVALVATPTNSAGETLRTVRADGFSMAVPGSWRLVRNVGSLKMLAMSRQPDHGFATNVNVLVTAPTPGSSDAMRRELARRLQASGIRLQRLRVRSVRLP